MTEVTRDGFAEPQSAFIAATSTSAKVTTTGTPSLFYGASIRETAGATAVVRIRDGKDATANPLAVFSFAANESIRDMLWPGVQLQNGGMFVEIVSGTVELTVWWG